MLPKSYLTVQGHIKVAYMKIGSISKTACRRAKKSLICAPWGLTPESLDGFKENKLLPLPWYIFIKIGPS